MLRKITESDTLKFHNLSPEEKTKRGILGRLSGPVASFIAPTRNGRKYTDDLWQKAFENELVKEMFDNGGLPGELDHPADRDETDSTKIAIMMPEMPKKDKDGHLTAYVDILNTPCGKIAYQLAKYGFKFGISSRGQGELIEDYDGSESVDPDSYTLTAFDLVLLPACADARLTFTESLTPRRQNNFKKSLKEALDSASIEEQEIMKETLNNLNINLDEAIEYLDKDGWPIPVDKMNPETRADYEAHKNDKFKEPRGNGGWDYNEDDIVEDMNKEENIKEKLSANDPAKNEIKQELSSLLYDLMKNIPDCEERDLQDAFRQALRDASEQLYDEQAMDEYEPIDEKLDLSKEKDFDIYDKLVYDIYAIIKRLKGKIYADDVSIAAEEAAMRIEDLDENLDSQKIEEEKECTNPSDCADIDKDKVIEESIEVEDNESKDIIEQLQDALKANKELEERLMSLQDSLAVRDSEVKTVNEELERYRDISIQLSTLAKNSKKAEKDVINLSEALKKKEQELNVIKSKRLDESVNQKIELKKFNEALENKDRKIDSLSKKIKNLEESISDLKADSELKNSEYNNRITKAKSLIKEYKSLANDTVNRYIESRARMIGVKPEEISNRLSEKYSVDDIDRICEDLMSYQVNINSLPFNITKKTRVKVTESKKDPLKIKTYHDDEIDEDLLALARSMTL